MSSTSTSEQPLLSDEEQQQQHHGATPKQRKYSCWLSAQLCTLAALVLAVVLLYLVYKHMHDGGGDGGLVVATCPGSPKPIHSTCRWTFRIPDHTCREVQEEVERRLQGLDAWKDPRKGKYKLVKSHTQQNNRSTDASHYVKEPYAYELFQITYGGDEKARNCTIAACSQTQDWSLFDTKSSNYCNVRNLVCGKSLGCRTSRHNMEVVEQVKFTNCLFHADKQCGVEGGGK